MRFRRTTRRPDEFRLDPNHPLAEGLELFAAPNAGHVGSMTLPDARRWMNREPNDGTLTNMDPATDWVCSPGTDGWSLAFDLASSQHVTMGKSFAPVYPFTLSAWGYYPTDQDQIIDPVLTVGVDSTHHFGIGFYSYSTAVARVMLWGRNTTYDAKYSTGDYLAQWVHVCGVFRSATDRELYANGISVGTDTSSITEYTTPSTIRLGADSALAYYFTGQIRQAMVHARALTESEISLLASRDPMLGGLIVPERRWWPAAVAGTIVNRTIAVQHAA